MRRPIFQFLLGFLALICAPLQVVTASAGRESASFLDIPVGAGPAAMGSAYSALANNAYAPVWNPAGLGFLDAPEVSAQHLSYVENIHYEFLSGVYPLSDRHGLGVSVQYLGTGDIAGTDINANPIGDYSSHFASYALSYGRALFSQLSVGASAKVIEAKISDVSAHSYAGDAGFLYRPRHHWTVAGVLTNMGTAPVFLESHDPLPLSLRLGSAYRLNTQWLISGEGRWLRDGPASAHAGLEWDPSTFFGLRAGYRSDTIKELSSLAGLSAGAAIRFWTSELAYAWLPLGDLGDTHYFSYSVKFIGQANNARPKNLIHLPSLGRQIVYHAAPTKSPYIDEEDLLDNLMDEPTVKGVASR